MTDFMANEHVCDKCGHTHKHNWDTQQEELTKLYGCADSTVDDYHRYYQKYRYVRARDQAMTFRAIADKYFDGDMIAAMLGDIAMSLSGWRSGVDRSADLYERMVGLAEKGCGCEDGDKWKDDE